MNAISGVLFFAGFVPYILGILQGDTAPSPVSWAIWASVDTLALAAMYKEKAAVGQLIGATLGAWAVTGLALWFGGTPTMGSIEWVSIVGALTGIVLWQTTGNALFAIVCAQAAVFIGAFPTFANAYMNPTQEDATAWIIWLASCACALVAVKKWDVANALQPITFTTIEAVMVFLIVVRPMWS